MVIISRSKYLLVMAGDMLSMKFLSCKPLNSETKALVSELLQS